MVDKILKQDQGITYGLFSPEDPAEVVPEEAAPEVEEGEEGEEAEQREPKKPRVEKLPRHELVVEVVEEPRIHFYQVPRLGSYLAIKLEYDSCLTEEAFDAAVVDLKEVEAKKAEIEKEKREFDEGQAAKKAEFDENNEDPEKQYEMEEKTWEEPKALPFKTEKVQYVVCLNTLGQDRKYTEEQKLAALRTVQAFRDRWEAVESENLENDVRKKLERAEYEK